MKKFLIRFKPYIVAICAGLGLALVGLLVYLNITKTVSSRRVWISIDTSGIFHSFQRSVSARGPLAGIKIPKAYIVQSGSMQPAIKTGSVVISSPAPIFSPGEVVTYRQTPGSKNLITHRIEARYFPDGIDKDPVYQTSGDANEDFDPGHIEHSQVVGKVILTIPYLGYVANFAKQPYGFILLVIVPATIVIYEELKGLFKEITNTFKKLFSKIRKRNKNNSDTFKGSTLQGSRTIVPQSKILTAFILIVSLSVPILGASLVFIGLASSFFADKETSQNNVLQAAAIFPGQAGSVVINEIYWGGSDGDGLDEWIELRNMTSTPINLANWVVENLGLGGPNANVSITSGTIPGNGFFLIARKNKDDSKRNIEEDFLVTVSLDNGGEQLVLKNDDGVIIDTANDSGDWFAGTSASPKKSMERNDTPSDGTVSTNWHSATAQTNMDADRTELASPKAANSAP